VRHELFMGDAVLAAQDAQALHAGLVGHGMSSSVSSAPRHGGRVQGAIVWRAVPARV
jgi:hypothetical protein